MAKPQNCIFTDHYLSITNHLTQRWERRCVPTSVGAYVCVPVCLCILLEFQSNIYSQIDRQVYIQGKRRTNSHTHTHTHTHIYIYIYIYNWRQTGGQNVGEGRTDELSERASQARTDRPADAPTWGPEGGKCEIVYKTVIFNSLLLSFLISSLTSHFSNSPGDIFFRFTTYAQL